VLRQVIDLRNESAAIDQTMNLLNQEHGKIHAEQQRIRENMQAIGDRPGEKELRGRFVKALNAQEDRLEEIDKELKEKTRQREICWKKINDLVGKLQYEATL
jgi:predicted phage gp36 major capsid-like protein